MSMTLTVVHIGVTEGGHTLQVNQKVKCLGHVPGGMVRIGIDPGAGHALIKDIAHPQCFAELR